jgi:hypothetical protein
MLAGQGRVRAQSGSMNIKGMDFTSVPSRRKPITCAEGRFSAGLLSIRDQRLLPGFEAFETVLGSRGPWVAGLDFPFGQSRRLVRNLKWPEEWSAYVDRVAAMSRQAFVQLLEDYKRDRPAGDREHFRRVDRRAASKSPQKLYGVPVAKMFYEGARRLLAAPVHVVPLRPNGDSRIVVEAYPALIARRFIGRRSYKNDARARQTGALRQAREAIVEGLLSPAFRRHYGFRLGCSAPDAASWIEDGSGDRLDAVLCAVQAAWAWSQRAADYGIPREADPLEGWIPDPGLQQEPAEQGRQVNAGKGA